MVAEKTEERVKFIRNKRTPLQVSSFENTVHQEKLQSFKFKLNSLFSCVFSNSISIVSFPEYNKNRFDKPTEKDDDPERKSSNHFSPLERKGLLEEEVGGFKGIDCSCVGRGSSKSESPGSGRLEVAEAPAIVDQLLRQSIQRAELE